MVDQNWDRDAERAGEKRPREPSSLRAKPVPAVGSELSFMHGAHTISPGGVSADKTYDFVRCGSAYCLRGICLHDPASMHRCIESVEC